MRSEQPFIGWEPAQNISIEDALKISGDWKNRSHKNTGISEHRTQKKGYFQGLLGKRTRRLLQ
jgi:hypothetical protein